MCYLYIFGAIMPTKCTLFQRTFYLIVSNNQYFLFKSASSVARHIGCSRNRLPKMLAKGVYTHKKSNSVVFTLNLQK